MLNDPIVDAVHQIRESIARSFNYDVKAIFADMRTRETQVGNRLVLPKKSPNKAVQRNGVPSADL